MIGARTYFDSEADQLTPRAEAEFYGWLKMRNATFKTTCQNRFRELDAEIAALVAAERTGPVEVLDVAVSAGTSTLELKEALTAAGLAPRICATDLFLEGRLFDLAPGLTVLTDRSGWPLQYQLGRRAIRPWVRRLDLLTLTAPLRLAAARMIAPRLGRMVAEGKGRRVTLASRRVADCPDIELIEDDILQPRGAFAGRFDLIRAANILNRNYFPEAQLRGAVRNLAGYLRGPGSLLLVTRTDEATARNDATLFRRTDAGRLAEVRGFGKGSEIRELVLDAL
ncbi:ATP-binding protein [Frigidibacter oleivorans]|uniref:ATP-binding protein n=1 Tax=Frigidibacter oleivorans TaxID=2487129 RepID=UPI000F8E8B86|nr:ATP-binding protein [Frigidibacter oleivorans]